VTTRFCRRVVRAAVAVLYVEGPELKVRFDRWMAPGDFSAADVMPVFWRAGREAGLASSSRI
jgi:hypothetical protein